MQREGGRRVAPHAGARLLKRPRFPQVWTHIILQDGTVVAWSEKADGVWSRTLVHDFGASVWRLSWSVTGGLLAVSDAKNNVTIWKETLDHKWHQIVE